MTINSICLFAVYFTNVYKLVGDFLHLDEYGNK